MFSYMSIKEEVENSQEVVDKFFELDDEYSKKFADAFCDWLNSKNLIMENGVIRKKN